MLHNQSEEESQDIKEIKNLLKQGDSQAKQTLEQMIKKWPNSSMLKQVNKIYFEPIPLNPAVFQSINNTNLFFHRLENLRADVKKSKNIPPMFVEFGSSNRSQDRVTNFIDRPTTYKPNEEMLFETTSRLK